MEKIADTKIENFIHQIKEHSSDQFDIIMRLREIVLSSAPPIFEEIKYGGILFSSQKNFCGVFSFSQHVTLEFSRGAQLDDPYSQLMGTGKYRRHIKIVSFSDIKKRHVAEYIKSARTADMN
ncbi:DUF1801 domain-containing protein [Brucellaceae bacterium C25G]